MHSVIHRNILSASTPLSQSTFLDAAFCARNWKGVISWGAKDESVCSSKYVLIPQGRSQHCEPDNETCKLFFWEKRLVQPVCLSSVKRLFWPESCSLCESKEVTRCLCTPPPIFSISHGNEGVTYNSCVCVYVCVWACMWEGRGVTQVSCHLFELIYATFVPRLELCKVSYHS